MRVVMVVHSTFPSDPRVRKEALALAGAGHDVAVVCLRGGEEAARDSYRGIRIRRMPVARRRSRGRVGYVLEYGRFFALAAVALERLGVGGGDVVHVHNIPDQLVYAAALARRRGARVVLDMHDPMPELFADKYGLAEGGRTHERLVGMQLAACRFADHVIVSSEPFRDALVARGIEPERVSTVINGPERGRARDPFRVVYHGSLFERYGLETVLRGLAIAADRVPSAELLVFGSDVDPEYVAGLRELGAELGIADRVTFADRIPPAAVRCVLSGADLGVVPARRSAHIDLVYSTKLFDFLSCGLPVLAARTPPVEARFGDTLRYYEPEDAEDFAARLVEAVRAAGRTDGRRRDSALPPALEWDAIAPDVVTAVTGHARRDTERPESGRKHGDAVMARRRERPERTGDRCAPRVGQLTSKET